MNQAVQQSNLINQRLTQDELSAELAYFTGTEEWYRNCLNRSMIYTDGVKFFAEKGGEQGAYWFIDKVACEIVPLFKSKNERFWCINLSVVIDKNEAVVIVTDGCNNQITSYQIDYTDMQPGDWKFYLINDEQHITLLLPGEN